ncbi:MAG: Gfo/Idh/MocA family oxidoreductase, partial [Bacteroidaceae bacterium]|nr:Gfo/Idh/MocA family oxidoreductase [Bacteroidaceae bacterium]
MKKVITYGTYDLLHQGHINLLQRAKALGDCLIVGVTNDNFDRERGKLNVVNNVLERVEAVKSTGLADKIIIEDYFGQKIDDIQKYDVDIFAIGSDWQGEFDYLKEFCEVVYLPRTEGISSTMLRGEQQKTTRIGIVGCGIIARRFVPETRFVSGIEIAGVYDIDNAVGLEFAQTNNIAQNYASFDDMLNDVDAVYVSTPHLSHYEYSRRAIEAGKHVLCEIPLALEKKQAEELYSLAEQQGVILIEANKTAHCPAFNHLMVMIKSGAIGEVVDIEASLSRLLPDRTRREFDATQAGGSMYESAVYPLLPIFRLLGTEYTEMNLYSRMENGVDIYTKGVIRYPKAVCSFKLGLGVKTEGNLVISGTKGYAYVQAPWW